MDEIVGGGHITLDVFLGNKGHVLNNLAAFLIPRMRDESHQGPRRWNVDTCHF
jgi:hypothetical protein